MSRAVFRLTVAGLGLAAALAGATAPASAAPVSIYGYYPSAESCNSVGQQGRNNGLWPWYTCFQSGQLWALQIPW
ncbi:hypothetical protein FXF51_17240 [Nonomuraea sp. PA05]|uniref:hypothetical protein n=1 Tax=Nonomuraea sp. PA05 TaxID=2604466 RepID=UPI0011D4A564|nr:hypothetical protein [Nonomuraea sp. PA05]TYB66830.1 hypothetical protein FXF51_17240 [Nonomuraea sp. PA05]